MSSSMKAVLPVSDRRNGLTEKLCQGERALLPWSLLRSVLEATKPSTLSSACAVLQRCGLKADLDTQDPEQASRGT